MAAANARVAPRAALDEDTVLAHAPLFKEDRPRRIDRVISFFGDDTEAETWTSSVAEPWSDR